MSQYTDGRPALRLWGSTACAWWSRAGPGRWSPPRRGGPAPPRTSPSPSPPASGGRPAPLEPEQRRWLKTPPNATAPTTSYLRPPQALPILWSFSQHSSATPFSASLAQLMMGPWNHTRQVTGGSHAMPSHARPEKGSKEPRGSP